LRAKLYFDWESKGGFLDITKPRLGNHLKQRFPGNGSYFRVLGYVHD